MVGHSSGGVIALELARQSPRCVATLSLLEPSLPVPASAMLAATVVQPAFAAYLAGDKSTAIDTFLAGVCGPDHPSLVDRLLPTGARRRAAEDADTLSTVEAPSVAQWGFDPRMLSELRMPVMSVLGERSDGVSAVSRQAHELVMAHVADVEAYVLPRATHFLQLHNPATSRSLSPASSTSTPYRALDGPRRGPGLPVGSAGRGQPRWIPAELGHGAVEGVPVGHPGHVRHRGPDRVAGARSKADGEGIAAGRST